LRGRIGQVLGFFQGDPRFFVVGIILVVTILVGIFAPFIAPHDPLDTNLKERLKRPGFKHILGTDQYGRDVASRIIWGARISMTVGILVVLGSMTIGCTIGTLAGFLGGVVDIVLMRLVDTLLAFPGFLLALVLVAVMGSSLTTVIIAIAIAYSPRISLVMRSVILTVRETTYVEASRALGGPKWWIILKHILPNSLPPMIVVGTVSAATAITAEAGLSFLGLGVQPPTPTWGAVIADGREFVRNAPWISVSAGLVIMLAVMSLNIFGDALRDYQDPRLKGTMRNV